MIYGAIKGQQLKVKAQAAADTIDYLIAKFTFLTADWEGLTKYAHFSKDQERYSVQLTDDEIKEEDHLNLTEGEWQIYLHGNEYRNGEVIKRVTTNIATFQVQPTGALNGEPFPEVNPSVVEQLAADVADHDERIEALEENEITEAEREKLAGIEAGAEVNKVIDVLDSDGNSVVGADRKARLPKGGGGAVTDVQDEQGNTLVNEGIATIPSEVVELLDGSGNLKYSIRQIFFEMPRAVMFYRGQLVISKNTTATTPIRYQLHYIRRNNYSPYNYQLAYAEFNEDGTIVSQNNIEGRWSEQNYTYAELTKLRNIEERAQVNIIEKIKKADGTELPITEKTVTLPEAEAALTEEQIISVCSILADFITDGTNIIGVDSTTALAF